MKYLFSLVVVLCFCSFSFIGKKSHTTNLEMTTDRYDAIDSFIHSSKIVVLDYWFMGCASCKKSIPEMNQIAKDYSDKGVKIYGLNPIDEPSKISAYHAKNTVEYNMFPITFELAKKCYIYEYPTVVVYKDNKVAMTFEGYSTLSQKQISDMLDKLLKK